MNVYRFLNSSIYVLLAVSLHAQWQTIGTIYSPYLNVWNIHCDKAGKVYTEGFRGLPTSPISYVLEWNGNNWSETGGVNSLLNGDVNKVLDIKSDYQGNILVAFSIGHYGVARFNGSAWSEVGAPNGLGADNMIRSVCADKSGNIYAAGDFKNGFGHCYVAKFDGVSWSELGNLNANGRILDIGADTLGNIYAVGEFSNVAGYRYVARWNGQSWNSPGDGALSPNTGMRGLHVDRQGNVYTNKRFANDSGQNHLCKWNGVNWTEVGNINPIMSEVSIQTITSDEKGNVYVAFGSGTSPDYIAAKWNGHNWQSLPGTGQCYSENNPRILSICTDSAGNLYAVGGVRNSACEIVVLKYSDAWEVGLAGNIYEVSGVSVFPNPATDKISIQATNGILSDVRIYDLTGKTLIYSNFVPAESKQLNISNLPPGLYIAEITATTGERKRLKLVKE